MENNEIVIEPSGEIVSSTVDETLKTWSDRLEGVTDETEVVIDLKAVSMLDSSGIALIVGMYKECVNNKGLEFRVTGCTDLVKEIFGSVKLDKILRIE